jgi:hypothetical protein
MLLLQLHAGACHCRDFCIMNGSKANNQRQPRNLAAFRCIQKNIDIFHGTLAGHLLIKGGNIWQ